MILRATRGHFDPARFDEVNAAIPAVLALVRALPGLRGERTGVNRGAGTSIIFTLFDTLEQAQFSRDVLGEPFARIQAAGWRPEAPEFYEVTE